MSAGVEENGIKKQISKPLDSFKLDFSLWKQGAEARLYVGQHLGKTIVIKQRFAKNYRHPELDDFLVKERLKAEAKGLLRCKIAGVRSPTVYFVDLGKRCIYLELISGLTVKQTIEQAKSENEILKIAATIGETVAKIHASDLIHGDLTTSNMIFDQNKLILLDFGLSTVSNSSEDKAVDLYVLERAITATHASANEVFDQILESYKSNYGNGNNEILKKYEEVKARGRKRTMVG